MRHFRLTALCLSAAALAFAAPALGEPTGTSGNSADEAFAGAMRNMMAGMHKAPSGDPDTDFVAMMLPHHQGAVDMAKVELRYGKDEGLKAMAKEIVTAQEKEIAMMKAWEDRKRHGH